MVGLILLGVLAQSAPPLVPVAIVGFVFAGRVEVRYTARPVTGPGGDFVSLMVGYGF